MTKLQPFHINAEKRDFLGNGLIGRYIFLPGSDGRAKAIAENFDGLKIKKHPRGHHLYLGSLKANGVAIDVAAMSSGMGCPSMEIILHELYHLGARRFLRVGTAGSLQPFVRIGDIINVQASVRDESTSSDYAPISVPAVASLEYIESVNAAAQTLKLTSPLHLGVVHCKSSLYAREFGAGPRKLENKTFLNSIKSLGVLASEMETATCFIQSQYYNHLEFNKKKVLTGAILGIISYAEGKLASNVQAKKTIQKIIDLALETTIQLALSEQSKTGSRR